MKKFGFTLIEVLITLSIIGVITALALPSLSMNIKKREWSSTLANQITYFENAMNSMLMTEEAYDLFETEAWKSLNGKKLSNDTSEEFVENLKKYIPIKESYTNLHDFYSSKDILNGNGSVPASVGYLTNNGILFGFYIEESTDEEDSSLYIKEDDAIKRGITLLRWAASIFVDVNGKQKPNTFGRDIFWFILGTDGKLYPYGSLDVYESLVYKLQKNEDNSYINDRYRPWRESCTSGKSVPGEPCTARLIENNFVMDY